MGRKPNKQMSPEEKRQHRARERVLVKAAIDQAMFFLTSLEIVDRSTYRAEVGSRIAALQAVEDASQWIDAHWEEPITERGSRPWANS